MACATGFCAGKIIAGVLGLGAASVLGYNWITTGCPTGVCPTERAAQAAITAAAFPAEAGADACCPAETKACADEAAACDTTAVATESCCALMAEAAVTTVAATLPAAPAGECCADKGATEPCDENKACCQENFGLATNAPANP